MMLEVLIIFLFFLVGIPAALIFLVQKMYRYAENRYPERKNSLKVMCAVLGAAMELAYFVWLLSQFHFPAQR